MLIKLKSMLKLKRDFKQETSSAVRTNKLEHLGEIYSPLSKE